MDIQVLKQLFRTWSGVESDNIDVLPASGSARQYLRMTNCTTNILGVFNKDVKENEAYFEFTRHFLANGIPVPKVELISENKQYYLVEDLGDDSLYNKVLACKGNPSDAVIKLYKNSLQQLIKMQITAGKTLDYSFAYPVEKFNGDAIQWDLNYFKYNYLKLSGVQFDELLLEQDFKALHKCLANTQMDFFMFRDFQSRNILIKNDEPYFIDFQGGRKGPLTYDVASLLYQAKAQLPQTFREQLFSFYCDELGKEIAIDKSLLLDEYKGFALLRTLQVLGAYGFRGYFEKKQHFIESIPYAIQNLNELLLNNSFPVDLPHLKQIASQLADQTKITAFDNDKLTVRVTSFSYRKGIPSDTSGNGGGFVFDCRGVLNPGRLKEYQHLTGKDEGVIQFFNEKTNINNFAQLLSQLVKPTIDTYVDRGFKHLMVSFGCTGGQHRSVFCAEYFSKFVRDNYKVNVVLWHREQGELIEYGEKM